MIWRFLEWKSKTLVQHLANRTNWEMSIPYDGSLGTLPLNQRKLTLGNPKSSRLSWTMMWIHVLLPMIFFIYIQEICFFVRSICFIQLKFSWINIGNMFSKLVVLLLHSFYILLGLESMAFPFFQIDKKCNNIYTVSFKFLTGFIAVYVGI